MKYEEETDATFHIPADAVVKAEREQLKPDTSIVQAATIPSSLTKEAPFRYTNSTVADRMLYQELSAVSDEVIKCRNMILNNVY